MSTWIHDPHEKTECEITQMEMILDVPSIDVYISVLNVTNDGSGIYNAKMDGLHPDTEYTLRTMFVFSFGRSELSQPLYFRTSKALTIKVPTY